jgi:hypothetical protein
MEGGRKDMVDVFAAGKLIQFFQKLELNLVGLWSYGMDGEILLLSMRAWIGLSRFTGSLLV